MVSKYLNRVLSSQRGEDFNPLIWPFIISLISYGIGFSFFAYTDGVEKSSLHISMTEIYTPAPFIWGGLALGTVVMGLSFLLFNIPPAGKLSGLVGFMLWVFAAFCWGLTGAWLLIGAVALPNLYFWFWQYLSLSLFRREDAEDVATMEIYDDGGYDDEENPVDSKADRENNRGVDEQF